MHTHTIRRASWARKAASIGDSEGSFYLQFSCPLPHQPHGACALHASPTHHSPNVSAPFIQFARLTLPPHNPIFSIYTSAPALTQGEEPDRPAVYNAQQGVRHGCLFVPDAESYAPPTLFVITIDTCKVTDRACILAEPDGGRRGEAHRWCRGHP